MMNLLARSADPILTTTNHESTENEMEQVIFQEEPLLAIFLCLRFKWLKKDWITYYFWHFQIS